MMTLKTAKITLRDIGMTINKQASGEYRVAFNGNYRDTEPSAYYTSDIEDAVRTGIAMHALRSPRSQQG